MPATLQYTCDLKLSVWIHSHPPRIFQVVYFHGGFSKLYTLTVECCCVQVTAAELNPPGTKHIILLLAESEKEKEKWLHVLNELHKLLRSRHSASKAVSTVATEHFKITFFTNIFITHLIRLMGDVFLKCLHLSLHQCYHHHHFLSRLLL